MRPSSLAPKPQTQSDGKNLPKEKLLEAGVRLGRDLEDRAKTTSVESARTHCVILKITKRNRDASSVNNSAFFTAQQKTENWTGRSPADIKFDFTEKAQILGTEAQRAILKRYIAPRENLGKQGSVARRDSAHWFS